MNALATIPQETATLELLRQQSGKSLGQILAEVKESAPAIAPTQRAGIIHWERQGITDVRVIRALSQVYGLPFEDVEKAALASRDRYKARNTSRN